MYVWFRRNIKIKEERKNEKTKKRKNDKDVLGDHFLVPVDHFIIPADRFVVLAHFLS